MNELTNNNPQGLHWVFRMFALPYAVVEKAAYIYRKVRYRKLSHGRVVSELVAGSAYAACREMSNPLTLKDIAADNNIKRKHIAKSVDYCLSKLILKFH